MQKAEFFEKEQDVQQKQGIQALIGNLRSDQRQVFDDAGGLEGLLARYQATDVALAFAHPNGEVKTNEPTNGDERELQQAIDTASFEKLKDQSNRDKKILNALGAGINSKHEVQGLYELAEIYLSAKNLANQTGETYFHVIKRFVELHGDLSIKELKIEHLREFSQKLVSLPANASSAKVRGLKFDDATNVAENNEMPTLCDGTQSKYISVLKSLTAFAVPQGYLQSDPWKPFKLYSPKRKHSAAEKTRFPFSPDDADRVLRQAEEYPELTIDRWAPLLACYQGARREEIGQLRGCDILEIDGVWCMQITDAGDNQKLKNASSFRVIPLHPTLIEEGFVRFAISRATESFLFQEQERWGGKFKPMRLDNRGRLTESYGKRFSRMLREKLKIEDPKLVFHSFRHSWEDAAGASGISEIHRRKISGRSIGNDSQAGYGNGPTVKALSKSLSKINPLRGS